MKTLDRFTGQIVMHFSSAHRSADLDTWNCPVVEAGPYSHASGPGGKQ
jgi:hypothetical protein